MQSLTDELEPAPEEWNQISPMLESAMGALGDKEQDAIVLRFYEQKSFKEVGVAMGASEDAVKMRVNRGLEKLRKFFRKRGVFSTTAIIGAAISGNSVQAAPIGLAGTVTTTAVHGAAVGSSTITLVKGTMKLMAWSKVKMAVIYGLTVVLVGAGAKMVVSQTVNGGSGEVKQIVQKTIDAYAALTSYSDSGTVTTTGGGATTQTAFTIRLQRPQSYFIEWNQTSGGAFNAGGKAWNDGTGDYFQMSLPGNNAPKAQKMQNMQMALGAATGVSSQAASMIPSLFFDQGFGNMLRGSLSGASHLTQSKDERFAGIDCFVITSELDSSKLPKNNASGFASKIAGRLSNTKTTFWIGKQDGLVHQTRTSVTMNKNDVKLTDSDITEMLKAQNKAATPEAIAETRTRMESMMKNTKAAGGTFVYTQAHDNIQVNQKLSEADFK
jgi:outer membrane lipoprotein-sorting protein